MNANFNNLRLQAAISLNKLTQKLNNGGIEYFNNK